MSWQTRSSRLVYENAWISVREDEVTGPAGDGIYGVVTMRHPAVFIVAMDEHDRVCLVTLERYATGASSLEVPAGGTDGEEPLVAARRELREETGVEAGSWELIGRMNALNGVACATEFVFLARDIRLAEGGTTADQAEEGIETVTWVPFGDLVRRIADGAISDGESIAAIMFAAAHLGRVS